jgi:zinc transport system substrate-binding protein
MRAALADAPRREIFTFHEAFVYFAAAFDLRVAGVIEREPGSEPGTRDLAEIVDRVRASGVTALFVEPQYPARVAGIIATETGASIYTLDPMVTGPLTLTAYEDAMARNLAALLSALR